MKLTRRSFLGLLASLPFVGGLFSKANSPDMSSWKIPVEWVPGSSTDHWAELIEFKDAITVLHPHDFQIYKVWGMVNFSQAFLNGKVVGPKTVDIINKHDNMFIMRLEEYTNRDGPILRIQMNSGEPSYFFQV